MGVDISEQAIKYAKADAQEARVEDICDFIHHDLYDWSFIDEDKVFDFILDWVAIHCIPMDKLADYANNIDQHCNIGGKFLVRSFASTNPEKKYFEEEVGGVKSKISLLTEEDLHRFFPGFRVLLRNTSRSGKAEAGYYFIELLMEKSRGCRSCSG